MKVQMDGLTVLKIVCFYLAIQLSPTLSQGATCPFRYLYHFGDGFTDIGNSIHVIPNLIIPPGRKPYGMTYPGQPTGRWSDGRVDFDFTAEDLGLPNIVPFLNMNRSRADSYDGVIFSVGRSPVLDQEFFRKRNIKIPPFARSLSQQMSWFRSHLNDVCSSPEDCSTWLGNTMLLLGDVEGNDIGYALTQGKSLREVRTYVPKIVKSLIDAAREVLELGATRVLVPGNVPLGCYPYVLTALETPDRREYDDLGCLKRVNYFTIWKNDFLEKAVNKLQTEYPDRMVAFSPMYDAVLDYIRNASHDIGPTGNSALKSCCGIGGKYNFNSKRFCGDKGVPVCSNPNDYIFWDGYHYTQHTQWDLEDMLIRPGLPLLNCTGSIDPHLRIMGSTISPNVLASNYRSSM